MANVDIQVAVIKGYNEEKKLLTESWLGSNADLRKEIGERIKQIDELLAKFKNPYSGGEDE